MSVFGDVGLMINSINILGMGITFFIIALIFGVARGISKEKGTIGIWFILLGTFAMLTIFSGDVSKSIIFLITAIVILLWGFTQMGNKE